ncbi:MAG: hypothetical protein FJ350_01710 [Sphingomonadales bacterium]|nr:hypothetical protein [Sphingomonadales bacterium]
MKGTNRSQAKAWAFSLLLHLILVLILGLLTLGIPQNDPAENKAGGMALALGVPDGLADTDPSVSSSSEQSAEPTVPEPKSGPTNPKSPPVETQDLEEAPVVNTKTSPPAETKPMDPRLQRLLNRKNSANQSSKQSPSQGVEDGARESIGQSNGSGGFSASGDGLENRGFAQDPDPEEFRILDAQVDIPIEVDREGRVRVIGTPKSTKPLTAQQRRALVEATQNARFKRSVNGKEIQRGILKFELKIRSKS